MGVSPRDDPVALRRGGEDERVVGDRVEFDSSICERRRAPPGPRRGPGACSATSTRPGLCCSPHGSRDQLVTPRSPRSLAARGALPCVGPGRRGSPRRGPPALPRMASTVMAPADSAGSASRSAPASANPPTAHIAWVPLTSARPSLGLQGTTGRRPGLGQRLASTASGTPSEAGVALADERQREVRERRQVAARARPNPARGSRGTDAGVQVVAGSARSSTGRTPERPRRQRVRAQEQRSRRAPPRAGRSDRRRPRRGSGGG